jgi:hypothetical protein
MTLQSWQGRLDGVEVGVMACLATGIVIFTVPLFVVYRYDWVINTTLGFALFVSAVMVGASIWVPTALGYWGFRRAGLPKTARGLIIGAFLVMVLNVLVIILASLIV